MVTGHRGHNLVEKLHENTALFRSKMSAAGFHLKVWSCLCASSGIPAVDLFVCGILDNEGQNCRKPTHLTHIHTHTCTLSLNVTLFLAI